MGQHGRLGIVALSIAALASLLIVACGVLFPTMLLEEAPDAAGDAAPADAHAAPPPPTDTSPPPAPTLCTGAQPPPQPASDTNSNIVPVVYAAIRTISFGDPDAGALGYNLDGVCTCEDSGPGDPVGPASCRSPMKQCDQPNGRDRAGNQIIGFLDELGYSESPEAYADGMIAQGILGIVLVVGNYNGAANDTEVLVSSYVVTLHDADGGLAAPKWDGTDAWNVDPLSAKFQQIDGGYVYVPLVVSTLAYVNDGVLVAELPELPTNFGLGPVTLSTIIFTATITPMPTMGGYALLNGQMTARISTASAFTALGTLADPFSDAGESLCGDDQTFQIARRLICSNVDIMGNSLYDRMNLACDGISLAVAFQAYPAKLGAPFANHLHPAGCDGAVDDCDQDF